MMWALAGIVASVALFFALFGAAIWGVTPPKAGDL